MNPAGDFIANSSLHIWSTVRTVRFSSGVFLLVLAVATVTANGALLIFMQRNAIRCLKTPTCYFFIGIGVADLLTGLLVEPVLAICHISDHNTCRAEIDVIQVLPPMVTNTSFLIVLLMSVTQYLAISYPHTYKWLVTKRRVALALLAAVLYTTAFSALKVSGLVREDILFAVEVCFHSTFIPFVLTVFYVMVVVALRRHTRNRRYFAVSFRRSKADSQLSIPSLEIPFIGLLERHFIRMNMLLVVTLLVCTLPSIVVLHVILDGSKVQDMSFDQQMFLAVAQYITENILFLKFLLDPLIFAWGARRL